MNTSQELAFQAKRAREATERRDSLILQLRAEGVSLRAIAEIAGLSHTAIKKIVVRLETPVAPL